MILKTLTGFILILAMSAGVANSATVALDPESSHWIDLVAWPRVENSIQFSSQYEFPMELGDPGVNADYARVDLTISDSQVVVDFIGHRSTKSLSSAVGMGSFALRVTEPTVFAASGFLNKFNESGVCFNWEKPCPTVLKASLSNETGPVMLYSHDHTSALTINESLTLAEGGADWGNTASGSLDGVLLPGTTYRFVFYFRIGSNAAYSQADAIGQVRLDLSPLPEGPHTATACDMDFNSDGAIGFDDVGLIIACKGGTGPCQDEMDTNFNTVVNAGDVQYVWDSVGQACTP